jgi:hypothetical protein
MMRRLSSQVNGHHSVERDSHETFLSCHISLLHRLLLHFAELMSRRIHLEKQNAGKSSRVAREVDDVASSWASDEPMNCNVRGQIGDSVGPANTLPLQFNRNVIQPYLIHRKELHCIRNVNKMRAK